MKTSLNIENEIFDSAKKEALKTGKSLGEVISLWARKGRETIKKQKKVKRSFSAVNLGGDSQIDLTRRKDWLEMLEE